MLIITLSYEVTKAWETILADNSIGRIISKLSNTTAFLELKSYRVW